MSDSLWSQGLYSPWNSQDQHTGVGSLSLLQGIFPTQGSNPGLPHCRRILYHLSHQGSPGILEWAAYPFSSGSAWPRNWTRVSCTAGGFFTNRATREVPQKAKSEGKIHEVCWLWKKSTHVYIQTGRKIKTQYTLFSKLPHYGTLENDLHMLSVHWKKLVWKTAWVFILIFF